MMYVGSGFEFENMLGLRIHSKLLNETLQPEAMFLVATAARDWLGTAAVSYNLADGWNLKAGTSVYGSFRESGDVKQQYGTFGNDNIRNKTNFYLELRFDF